MAYRKILKYWHMPTPRAGSLPDLQMMDVTKLHCEEDQKSLQLLDENDKLIAEFGPGKVYEGWLLTEEYLPGRLADDGACNLLFGGHVFEPQGNSFEWQRI
jgi:hypothetical protein